MRTLDLSSALQSCRYYPVHANLRERILWFAEIDREMYRRAGFLVPKQAKMSEERYGFNLDDVLLYDLSLPIGGAPSHYVFISAFCCSTLLARLLDRVPGCLVLKEPGILGQLGTMRYRPVVSVIPAKAGIHREMDPRIRGGDTRGSHGTPFGEGVPWASPEFKNPRHEPRAVATKNAATAAEWEEEWRTWSRLGMRLLTRTFDPGQTVIVKPSDVGNSMCDVMLENDPRSKAVLLSVDLRTFILSVLKMEDRKKLVNKRANLWHAAMRGCCHPEPVRCHSERSEESRHFPEEYRDSSSSRRGGTPQNDSAPTDSHQAMAFPALSEINAAELNDAQKAAYVWLVTAAFWDRLRKQIDPERLLPLDGEEVSENPGAALRKVTDFFGLPLEEERLEEILSDPVLSHHAKFPGQVYDASARQRDHADWEARFGAEAGQAMDWAAPIQERMESGGVDFSVMAGAGCKELVA